MFRFAFRRTRSPGPSDNYNKISKHDSWRMNTVSWFRQIKSPAFQKALADFGLIGLILLLLFYIRWIYCIFANVEFFSGKMIKDVVVSSNTPAQPLYTIEDNFFPQEQFDEIRAGLISGKLATAKNSLNAKTFGNTSGVVIVFSAKGEARLRRNPKLKDIVTFLDAIRLKDIVTFLDAIRVEGANAYVVNILKAQSSKKEDGAVTSAGAHFDGRYSDGLGASNTEDRIHQPPDDVIIPRGNLVPNMDYVEGLLQTKRV
eukprot:gene22635-29778_t